MPVNKRIRRSPEEARQHILAVAERRLAELGLEGLSVQGVAEAAGISHANVIHHFGTTQGMRTALFMQMSAKLLADVDTALRADIPPDQVLGRLFGSLLESGHGKLLAWRMLANVELPTNEAGAQFQSIVNALGEDQAEAKRIVLLVAGVAMGIAICREPLQQMIGIDDSELSAFPGWLGDLLTAASDA